MTELSRRFVARLRSEARCEDGFGLVETLIAFTILVIGLLAVSGLTLASATQARIADRWSDIATAGQMVIETVQLRGYDSAVNRTDTVSVGGKDYPVTLTVTTVSSRVREVQAVVDGSGPTSTRTFTARVYRPRGLPSPYDPTGLLGGGGGTPTDSTTMPPDSTIAPPDTTTIPVDGPPEGCSEQDWLKGKC
ncbi:MAG: prepilin-type N-terminal cleavage/methylation domain-containing protein [marine benthic group bacterium]|nr:prepilin-type N-terminal cleavage/methylation domain-containing protein [Gemmatimonadota bacterium]